MPRIVAISDTHLQHIRAPIAVPDGDILIHAGDAMIEGGELEARAFFTWFAALPHGRKIFVAGNHDTIFQKNPRAALGLVPEGVTYLQDSEVTTIDGLRIYGSPWTPEFMNWAFNVRRGRPIQKKWDLIPTGLDILVTHGPPMGILDQVLVGKLCTSSGEEEHLGCRELRHTVLRVKPRLHLFGHIHSGHGKAHEGGTQYANVAICDESYRPTYPATVIELEPRNGP